MSAVFTIHVANAYCIHMLTNCLLNWCDKFHYLGFLYGIKSVQFCVSVHKIAQQRWQKHISTTIEDNSSVTVIMFHMIVVIIWECKPLPWFNTKWRWLFNCLVSLLCPTVTVAWQQFYCTTETSQHLTTETCFKFHLRSFVTISSTSSFVENRLSSLTMCTAFSVSSIDLCTSSWTWKVPTRLSASHSHCHLTSGMSLLSANVG